MDDNEDTAIEEDPQPSQNSSHTQPAQEPPTISELVATATDRTLEFISTASNETLGACIVGLGATSYIILGRVGLVLIGVVGGVALHASWESKSREGHEHAGTEAGKKESGLDVVRRVLDWKERREAAVSDGAKDTTAQQASIKATDFSGFKPETAAALDVFADAVVKDYVKWWYSPLIPNDTTFPMACRDTLTSFIIPFSSHLSRKRPADTLLDFITNSSSIIVVFLTELSSALSASNNNTPAQAVQVYLDTNPMSNLASLMDQKHQQRKLQLVAEDILENFLDVNVYKCSPVRAFLREILANVVLDTTIQKCSKSEWINEWIVYLLDEGEPELLHVIDAGVQDADLHKPLPTEKNKKQPSISTGRERSTSVIAEEVMDEALREAQRLTKLISDQDAEQLKAEITVSANHDDTSERNTHGIPTPTSSQSDGRQEDFKYETPTLDEDDYESSQTFISFDQLAPLSISTPTKEKAPAPPARPVEAPSLCKASIFLYDDEPPGDNRPLRSKPTGDYLLQIEPASSKFPGWMMSRTYDDFTTLHEILRRISAVSGIAFVNNHAILPPWRGSTAEQLRAALEQYIVDAVRYEQLAESEGLKRFLEKDRGLSSSSPARSGLWSTPTAFENMGKGMLDVLTKAPKDVAGGGKAFFGGLTNVLTGGMPGNLRKGTGSSKVPPYPSTLSRVNSSTSMDPRASSQEDLRRINTQGGFRSIDEARRSSSPPRDVDPRSSMSSRRSSTYGDIHSRTSGLGMTAAARGSNTELNLMPPPLSDITDDFLPSLRPTRPAVETHTSHMSADGTSFFDVLTPPAPSTPALASPIRTPPNERASFQSIRNSMQFDGPAIDVSTPASTSLPMMPQRQQRTFTPISTQEAVITTELLFAMVTSLYTLSSAWNFRRTLLTAAKTFLLRPGNPQLESIRMLMQTSLLDANTSDAGIATHILKLRENALPTPEELNTWPKPRTESQKEDIQRKARRLLIERGMPQALTSVMGTAASGEALGKVFDALQVEDVARGVMFALVLQGIKAVVQ